MKRKKKNRGPDKVCEEYAGSVNLHISKLEGSVLIEGDRATLEFLAALFGAVACAEDCGFQISPVGAGKALFRSGSKAGLYIHRIDRAI